jgi:3-deoxy-D-manno-octulosonic-acid transferase
MKLLLLIYDVFFIVGGIFYLPLYFLRKKVNLTSLREKIGYIPFIKNKDGIWIQVVSVGEVNLIGKLLSELKKKEERVVISTTTLTGNRLAKEKYSSIADIIYFPFDISFILEKVIKKIRPKIFISIETEIWPNLFYRLKKRNVPIVIINGRISKEAFTRYKMIRPIVGKILNKCDYIGVQNQLYKERFISLGASSHKVYITGNMKFEGIQVNKDILNKIRERYFSYLKKENNLIFVAGSTHYPEEEIIIKIYKKLITSYKKISLIIAPRHIERIPHLEKVIISEGFKPIRISRFNNSLAFDEKYIFLIDTIGQLLYFYGISDICFVGGSLTDYGGHNILEPIYFCRPVLFGPFMDNFKEIERVVLEKKAAFKVKNKEELENFLWRLAESKELREELSKNCKKVFEEGKNSLKNNLELILKCLN